MPSARPRTASAPSTSSSDAIVCLPRILPRAKWVKAARRAAEINPMNSPAIENLGMVEVGIVLSPEHLAVLTTKYWKAGGVKLTVGFMDNPAANLRSRILAHMNAWAKTANVKFVESKSEPQVRIARLAGDGYWSYLGTDVLEIPANEATMNLDSFSMNTPESEFHRVVRHETGHTMGFPHEHMRRELVELIDAAKAIKFFGETQGWDEQMVRRQVLTPIEESSLLGTLHADPNSIMCYQIPGSITKDGKPIVGGLEIAKSDFDFAAKLYPKTAKPKPKTAKTAAARGRRRAPKRRAGSRSRSARRR
jgi:hypothetical protein